MKIRSISLNQFKKFTTPIRLQDIGDGLNVIVGPNEMGKSTLLDALRAALFEKYSSKAQPIVALQNDRNKAAPVVELSFEIDDGVYRITKRFIKKPYAQLACPDGRKLEGDAAEQTLRDLLGFEEAGKSGAKAETLGMWNVLWVKQGHSFGTLDLPSTARSDLHSALESEVGEVLGGKRGRALPDAIEKQLSALVTPGANRPRGQYKAAIDEVDEFKDEYESLKERRRALSEALDKLESEQQTLNRIEEGGQDEADRGALATARTRYGELERLETRIDAAKTDLQLKQQGLNQAQADVTEREQLRSQIIEDEETLRSKGEELIEADEAEESLREKVKKLRDKIAEAEEAVTNADSEATTARHIKTAVEREQTIKALQGRYEKAKEAESTQRKASKRAAAILVTEEKLEAVRKAEKKLESARVRLSAAATRVSFNVAPDQLHNITVDREDIAEGRATMEVVAETTITIKDVGSIVIEPAIKDRADLLSAEREAKSELSSALEPCRAASAEDAETQFNERSKHIRTADLAKQEAAIHAPKTEEHEAGAEPLADYIAGLSEILEEEKAALGLESLPSKRDAEERLEAAERKAIDERENLSDIRAELTGPAEELDRLTRGLSEIRARHQAAQYQLNDLKSRLSEAENLASDSELAAAASEKTEALESVQSQISELEAAREGESLPQLEARISRLTAALDERAEKRRKTRESIIALKSQVEMNDGAGLDERIQHKERELELAKATLKRFERETQVLSLLLETLRSAESEAKERYLSPVLNRVRPYLQTLFPGADIAIDENLQIVGVVRENGYEEPFEHLSIGTQEQIAVLVRLAFAEMLVEQGHPATVVLDDALVFSDDRRMDRMFDILNMVGKRVQIIVLTCREQLFEGIGGKHLVLAKADPEALQSA